MKKNLTNVDHNAYSYCVFFFHRRKLTCAFDVGIYYSLFNDSSRNAWTAVADNIVNRIDCYNIV